MASSNGRDSSSCPSLMGFNQFAYCHFHYKHKASITPESTLTSCRYGILLRLHLKEVPMAIVTSYQTLPSADHINGLHFGVLGKEYDITDLLSSSQAELLTCCGEGHSFWKNTEQHIGRICPRKGDFAALLLKSKIAREIHSVLLKLDGKFQVAGLLDCMSLEEIQEAVKKENGIITVNVCGVANVEDLKLKINCTSLLQPEALPDHHVKSYCNSYMQLVYNTQSTQQACGLGLPIIYHKSSTDRWKLLGMHTYLESQSAQYGILLVHIIDLLRTHQPDSFPYYEQTYQEVQLSYIPTLAMLAQNVRGDFCECALCHYKNLYCFLVTHHTKLSPPEHLLLLDYLVREKLLFAQSSCLDDDMAMKIYSLRIISVVCSYFDSYTDEVLSDILATLCAGYGLSHEKFKEMVRVLCEDVSHSMVHIRETELTEEWFSCWESIGCLKGIAAPFICQSLGFIKYCLSYHRKNVEILTSYGKVMEVCYSAQLQQVQLLEKEKAALESEKAAAQLQQVRLFEKAKEALETRDKDRMLQQQSEALAVCWSSSELCSGRIQETVLRLETEIKELRNQLDLAKHRNLDWASHMQNSADPKYLYSSSENSYQKLKQQMTSASPDYRTNGVEVLPSRAAHGNENSRPNPNLTQSLQGSPQQPQRPPYGVMHSTSSDSFTSSFGPEEGALNSSSLNRSLDSVSLSDASISASSPLSEVGRPSLHNTREQEPVRSLPVMRTNSAQRFHSKRQSTDGCTIDVNPAYEEKYKQIIQDNLDHFIKYTNFVKLLPILAKYSLVDCTEAEEISSSITGKRATFFFFTVLPSKGNTAYNTFARCISEERDHLGHATLLQLLRGETVTDLFSPE